GRRLNLMHFQHGEAISDIAHNRQTAETKDNLAQKFKALGSQIGGLTRQPVTLPPRRARLATRPGSTRAPADANTIGITAVASFATRTGGVPDVTMTSTFRPTNSAAISPARSLRPSAQRYSIAIVRPSIQPSSPSRRTKAAVHGLVVEAVYA